MIPPVGMTLRLGTSNRGGIPGANALIKIETLSRHEYGAPTSTTLKQGDYCGIAGADCYRELLPFDGNVLVSPDIFS
jgi:hypothetical protein